MTDIGGFLEALWGRKDEDRGLIEIFSGVARNGVLVDVKAKHWLTADGATGEVERLTLAVPKREIYVGVGLGGKAPEAGGRNKVENIIGLSGLFADVDFAGASKKKLYPPDEAAALRVIEATGIEPTMVVHSGHGLQAWWLGEETVYFDGPEDKERWRTLAARWVDTLAAHANELGGWSVDPAKDLARILRIVGTTNHKGEEKPVRLLRSGPRYADWSIFEERAVAAAPVIQLEESVGPLVLDPNASPPAELLTLLLEADPKIRRTWNRQRSDMKDQSASAYDQAMANFAIRAGWTDQNTANLIIAFRRFHHEPDLKLRQGYYQGTIEKAKAGVDLEAARARDLEVERAEKNETAEDVRAEIGLSGDCPKTAPDILESVSKKLELYGEFAISRVVKLSGDPATYRLYTSGGSTVELGDVGGILDQRRFRKAIADCTQQLAKKIGGKAWDGIAGALLASLDVLDVGGAGHPLEQISGLLEEYLEECSPDRVDDWQESAMGHAPFRKEGEEWISTRGFLRYMNGQQFERTTEKRVAMALKLLGWRSERLQFRMSGHKVARNLWARKTEPSNGEKISMPE